MESNTYQVVVTFGDIIQPPAGVKVVPLMRAGKPEEPTALEDNSLAHHFLDEMRAARISPSDVRARVLFVSEPSADPDELVTAYALTCFFAGRRVDFQLGDELTFATEADNFFRNTLDAGPLSGTQKLDELHVTLNKQAETEAGVLVLTGPPTPTETTLIRHARRVTMEMTTEAASSLTAFLMVAAIRARGKTERLPTLIATNGDRIDMDLYRRAAAQIRKDIRPFDPDSIVEQVDVSARCEQLIAAASVPAPAVMLELGASAPEGSSFWHCPRPDRHTNGDANASMRAELSRVQCFRCDAETVDVVRLVADVKSMSFTEAAEWILSEVKPKSAALMDSVSVESVADPVMV
jgi:hypothetical protein